MTPRDIAELFIDLEMALIASYKRNLQRHIKEEAKAGVKYTPWQILKLRSVRQFVAESADIVAEHRVIIDKQTRALINEAFDGPFLGVNAEKVRALVKEVNGSESNALRAALRYTNDAFRKTISRSATLSASGVSIQKATDTATKEFLEQGIKCIQYKDGRRVNIATYAEMALRTADTRAQLLGDAQRRSKLGIDTVLVSHYGGCSETCLPWQGRVYIDDVWQPYSGQNNGSYGYSVNGGQYPLLSVAVRAGLFHPNCRHTLTTWIEGKTTRPQMIDANEIRRRSELEQRQRHLETLVRKYKRLEAGTLDPQSVEEYKAKRILAQRRVKEFVDKNDDVLRRNYWRERA